MQARSLQRTIGRRIALVLALCGLLAYGGSAFARGDNGGGGSGAGSRSGGTSSNGGGEQGSAARPDSTVREPVPIKLQKLLERHHLTQSRILDAEIIRQNGLWIYELKLLSPDGVVRELRYNALNGNTLPHYHD